ncbi:MAG: EAL domain-containing protein [Acidobacteriota bacterium]|nr:EAL domain-containing protein [Acidobacteriota bacterium]
MFSPRILGQALRPKNFFTNSSVRRKLLLLIALTSSFALLLAGVSLLGYEAFQFRSGATRELNTLAEIIGASSTGALSFADERAAGETLAALAGDRRIIAAAIYDAHQRRIAVYRNPHAAVTPLPAQGRSDGVSFEGGNLLLFHPIVFHNERLGTLFLRSDLIELHSRLYRYAGIVCLVLLASLALASLLSSRLANAVSEPIAALATIASRVSVNKDYSVRAPKTADDEIGVLIDAFNEMLSQIEIREEARKIGEAALRESEERYALAAQGANDGLWDWKLASNQIYFSPRWTRMLGYSDNEIWSDPEEWFSRIHPADRDRVRKQLTAHCEGKTTEFSSEYRMRHRNGPYVWMLSRGMAVRDAYGTAIRIAGSQTDITEGKIADTLTELPNRIYFTEKLENALAAKTNPDAMAFAVLFVDLDRFKVVNDSLGHAAGDQLLVGVAQRLCSSVRGQGLAGRLVGSSSTVARLGGDEFAILVEGIRTSDDAVVVAERILKHLAPAFFLDGRQVFANASIGVAMGSSGNTPEDLLRNADTAMYHAKARGRGRSELFDQGMRERAVARTEIETDLKVAVEANQFVLHYQPKVSVVDERITGFEALIRWNHPKRGLLFPSEFITVAEEIGLIIPIGLWVLREGCRQMAEWHKTMICTPPLTISINISFKQLGEAGLAEDVERILAETGLEPETLRLEMTESSIMENARVAIATLHRFKELNIGLEIDDFGTGYSSLSYLRQLPFDTVKIDRSFVKELGTEDDTSGIITTILQLADSLKMDVVAEGVETSDQLARLAAMGCASAQGYYFSKPVNAESAQRLVRDKDALARSVLLKPVVPVLVKGPEAPESVRVKKIVDAA